MSFRMMPPEEELPEFLDDVPRGRANLSFWMMPRHEFLNNTLGGRVNLILWMKPLDRERAYLVFWMMIPEE